MKIFLLALALLAASFGVHAQQHSDRTVETSGKATTKMLADQIFLVISVQSGESCEIPSGRHYQKYIKDCAENNKKLVATRENILAGLVASYAGKVRLLEHVESGSSSEFESYSSAANAYYLYFTNYADYTVFLKDLKEYKDAFNIRDYAIGCSKYTDAEANVLRLDALKDARKKAEDMCTALGVSIDKVLNIYEKNQWGMDQASGLTDYGRAMYTGGNGRDKSPESFGIMMTTRGWPDEDGNISFSESCYLRLLIK